MEEITTKGIVCETYEAFKTRKQNEFYIRHVNYPSTTQRKLLQVHLRHFLLTIGNTIDREWSRDCKKMATQVNKEKDNERAEKTASLVAVSREKSEVKRHQKARVIQRFVRQYRSQELVQVASFENEIELQSTSKMIAMEKEDTFTAPLQDTTEIASVNKSTTPDSAMLPLYELVIELVGIRNLTKDLTAFNGSDGFYVETSIQLKRQSFVVASSLSKMQFVSEYQDGGVEILVQDCSLRFNVDPANMKQCGLTSPQSALEELNANIVVRTFESGSESHASTLGNVEISLATLKTSLATKFVLCRWFPLTKALSGHSSHCDLRIRVCYFMRQTSVDNDTMVPYVNTSPSLGFSKKFEIPQERNERLARQRKRKSAASKSKCQKTKTNQILDTSDKLNTSVRSLKNVNTSPIARISHAEAISPPPSPCSVTSSEAGEIMNIPKGRCQATPSRKADKLSKKQHVKCGKVIENAPTQSSVQASSKTFLRRKPYTVVFKKLDWSNVTSKTDSNLPNTTIKGLKSSVSSRSAPCLSSSRATNSSTRSENTEATSEDANSFLSSDSKLGDCIDVATNERLAALEGALFKQCSVTRDTVPLARYKYEAERKKIVATLQSQAQVQCMRSIENLDEPSSQVDREPSTAISESAMKEVWKRLSSDVSGQIYASMLRNSIKVIEANDNIEANELIENSRPANSAEPVEF
ncbi:uncharacterized protein PHALS_08264 [Plasmopara halstedii]|uniref:Uncharacterized protein n=1 Tax=Plasmopara halstedii TaxID=4781 RepID=A0A0P1ABX3_PLAHL|nr:uncharacterized protein PHALS_08264 [Plasmopara halstedii]CEG38176.1 hypothetical protein PHALS_08264 [Plasmopara halstedii]|eukprot:XP_024574545.1 hypothetical protein PHALS_08264 [Plasmopara halstedii]